MRHLPLVGFFAAHAITTLGTKMTMVALPLLVYATTGSAARTGLVAFVQMGMYVLAKAAGAPLIDRLGRKRVAISAEFFAAATVACVPALYGIDVLPFAGLLALLGLVGAAQGLSSGATRVLLPEVAEKSGMNLERALTIFDGVDRLGSLLGAPAGGFLVAGIGAANVLWIDAATYAVSASLLAAVVPMTVRTAVAEHEPYLTSLRSGWTFLASKRIVLVLAVVVACGNLLDQTNVAVMLPVWVTDVLEQPEVAGLVFGAGGLGAVLGNLLFIWLAPKLPRRRTFGVCYVLSGCPQFLSMAFFDTPLSVIAIVFAAGFAGAALNPILSAVSFEKVPDDMRTRVFGLTGAISFVGIPFGGLLGGLAVSVFGVVNALWITGGLYLLVTLSPFVFPVWRDMDRAPTPGGDAKDGALV